MLFLPDAAGGLAAGRRRHDDAMQPAMPFRRHLRRIRRAVVHHPATLPLLPAGPLVQIVFVAELVGADQLPVQPGEEAGSDAHLLPFMAIRGPESRATRGSFPGDSRPGWAGLWPRLRPPSTPPPPAHAGERKTRG